MKKIIFLGFCCLMAVKLEAQVNSSLAFHVFYDDFKTAQQIKTSSLNDVLKNGKWSGFSELQMGFGLNYLQRIKPNIDFAATVDGGSINYLFKDGTNMGSSKFLLDINAGLNLKLFSESHHVIPYFFGGSGFSYYNKKAGIYFPAGLGVQFNLFDEAFILTNMQYRVAATATVNHHFYYTVGVGLPLSKIKKAKPVAQETAVPQAIAKPVEAKIRTRAIRIQVMDEQTGLPLPAVAVVISGASGNLTDTTAANGEVVFKAVPADNYTVKGMLNGINTAVASFNDSEFDKNEEALLIRLSHNDPRFTLSGLVLEKNTNKPMGNVVVNVVNQTNGTPTTLQSRPEDGTFNIQLNAASDFVITAKKAAHLSNIESVSTRGLNRSTTLYVKLALAVEEVKENSTITLSNIYYDTGSAQIRQDASSDLEKLVLFLVDNPEISIEIASHTDSRGSAASNLTLSQRRAQEVVNYLKWHGINGSRLISRGYGETRLINGCKDGVPCTAAQHEQNRRTEFKVVAKN
ncbi:MAG: OmpA family protein [Bacteroidota bacterium]